MGRIDDSDRRFMETQKSAILATQPSHSLLIIKNNKKGHQNLAKIKQRDIIQ